MNLTDLHPGREPALLVAALLAPTVQTALLVWGRWDDEAQAVWNALAAAVAGLLLASLAAREKLAPAILGAVTAVLALGGYYAWGLTAAQDTAVASLASLATGLFLRTQITAPIDVDGQRVRPDPDHGTLEESWMYPDPGDEPVNDGPDPASDPAPVVETEPVTPVEDGAPPDGFYEQPTPGQWLPPAATQSVGPIEGRRMAG